MCACFCIGFIDFMLKGKGLLEYTNSFSRNDYEKNNKIILKYLQQLKIWKNCNMKKLYCIICSKYRTFENPKISYLLERTVLLSIILSKCKNKDQKIFKEEYLIDVLKVLGLINNIEEYQKI